MNLANSTMATVQPTPMQHNQVIPDIYLRHLEEFQFLWMQRYSLLSSPELGIADLADWRIRMDAHLSGLLVAGEAAIPILAEAISSDSGVTFAAAFTLLKLNRPEATAIVFDSLFNVGEGQLDEIAWAICCLPNTDCETLLADAYAKATEEIAVVAAMALAAQDRLHTRASRWVEFFHHDNPFVRARAWQIASILDGRHPLPASATILDVTADDASSTAKHSEFTRAVLRIVSGEDQDQAFIVRAGERCSFGRKADVPLTHDDQISATHFQVDCTAGQCVVRDLASTNGTYVNDERQVEIAVRNEDVIRAGRTLLQIEIPGEAPAPGPAPTAPTPLKLSARVPDRPFDEAFVDENIEVREAAMLAAGWGRQTWLLDYCRGASQNPCPENWAPMILLAILGEPTDLTTVLKTGRTVDLGPARFRILGAFGHPGVVDDLLVRLESKDAPTSDAAAGAIEKITGFQIPSADSSASELLTTPSAAAAVRRLWRQSESRFRAGARWCRGFDVSRGARPEQLAELDLESRWEAQLRDHFRGIRNACLGADLFESVIRSLND